MMLTGIAYQTLESCIASLSAVVCFKHRKKSYCTFASAVLIPSASWLSSLQTLWPLRIQCRAANADPMWMEVDNIDYVITLRLRKQLLVFYDGMPLWTLIIICLRLFYNQGAAWFICVLARQLSTCFWLLRIGRCGDCFLVIQPDNGYVNTN